MKVKINNVPNVHKRFIVARLSESQLWFWGSWEDGTEAERVALEVDGVVIDMED